MLLVQVADSGPSVGQLVAIMAGAIPILGILGWTAVRILSPITQAFGRRLAGHGGEDDELRAEVEQLRAGVDEMRQQLIETHERLDFTERLLAQGRAPEQLPRG